jgi:hypothetical protein
MDCETKSWFHDPVIFLAAAYAIILGVVGFVVVAAFWLCWYMLLGEVPRIAGFSRLWLDVFGGFVYAPIIVFLWSRVKTDWDEVKSEFCLPAFVIEKPKCSIPLAILGASLLVGLIWSLPAGLCFLAVVSLEALGIYFLPIGLKKII